MRHKNIKRLNHNKRLASLNEKRRQFDWKQKQQQKQHQQQQQKQSLKQNQPPNQHYKQNHPPRGPPPQVCVVSKHLGLILVFDFLKISKSSCYLACGMYLQFPKMI